MTDERDERAWREISKQNWRDLMEAFKREIANATSEDVHVAFQYHDHEPFVRLIIELPGVSYAAPIGAPELRLQAAKFMDAADSIEERFGTDLDFGMQGWHGEDHD